MKILYITTISDTMDFFPAHIQMLIDQGHTVDLACKLEKPLSQNYEKLVRKIFNISFHRSPYNLNNFRAYKELKRIVVKENYDVVHTHTPVASVITRLACKELDNVTVLYTAHGFHFFKGAPIINWLIYYPIERWLSSYTDVLITINKEDYERAKKIHKTGRVKYIPGVGINVNKYRNENIDKRIKRDEIGVPENAFLILSVGEINKNKNHETIIKAIAKLRKPNLYYVICGIGPLESRLKELALQLGLKEQVKLLGFRRDMPEIYKVADLFALPSKREGLGLAALEAMSSGLPLVTSNVHGILDYSIDGVTGYNCNPCNVEEFKERIKVLMEDDNLRKEMGANNTRVVENFDISITLHTMNSIYRELIQEQ